MGEAGTPSYLADSNGDTPLHLIRNLMSQESHVAMDEVCELVRVLLEKSANPEKLIALPDVKGRSLLSYAVEAGDRCAALSRLFRAAFEPSFRLVTGVGCLVQSHSRLFMDHSSGCLLQ